MALVYFTRGFRSSAAYRRALAAYTATEPPAGRPPAAEPPATADWHDAWAACAAQGVYFGHCPGHDGIAAAHTWFVDSPVARRFLRALARAATQKGWKLQVRQPRPEEYLTLPRPAAVKVVVFHGTGGGKDAWDAIEVFARQWHR